jgi:hypothetical protein
LGVGDAFDDAEADFGLGELVGDVNGDGFGHGYVTQGSKGCSGELLVGFASRTGSRSEPYADARTDPVWLLLTLDTMLW